MKIFITKINRYFWRMEAMRVAKTCEKREVTGFSSRVTPSLLVVTGNAYAHMEGAI